MRFIQFEENLKNFIVFNIKDIRKVEKNFDLRRLSEWQEKGYIKIIRKGYYVFGGTELNESILFLIANKIYPPSYISFEMAFSYYNLIPESVYGITSATSKKTNKFITGFGEFTYRHLKPEFLFGYKLVEYKEHKFQIAEAEKALLDYFYINPHLKTYNDFDGLRFNAMEFKKIADSEKIKSYLAAFSNKILTERISKFLTYIKYA